MSDIKKIDKISNRNKYDENPRTITKKEFQLLEEHIKELGDLSGVVYCHKNEAFVGGNQRSEIFNGSLIEITERYDKPNHVGTVAHGFIVHNGEKYAYREVYFMKNKFEKACVVANYDGGSFDWDIIANKFSDIDLGKWGVKVWKTDEVTGKKLTKSILVKFNAEDIEVARELIEHFKTKDVYIGKEIIKKLKDLRDNE